MQNSKQTSSFNYIPLLLLGASFLLRLSLISKGPFSGDCLAQALLAEEMLDKVQLKYYFGSGYPLTLLFCSLFIFIGRLLNITDPVAAFNFLSVLFSSLTVVSFYFLTRRLFDSTTAVLASILLCLHPIFLGISVFGNSHASSLFFLMTGFYFAVKSIQKNSRNDMITGAVLTGLGGACRLQDMICILLPLGLYVFLNSKEEKYKRLGSFLLITFMTACLFYLPYFLGENRLEYIHQFFKYRSSSVSPQLLPNAWMAQSIFLIDTMPPVEIIVFIYGFLCLAQKERKHFIVIFTWILIPLTLYSFLYTIAPRFLNIYLPAIILTEGFILSRLLRINRAFTAGTLIVFALIVFLSFSSTYPILLLRHKKAYLPEFVKWAKGLSQGNAYMIPADDRLFFQHYGAFKIIGRPLKTSDYTARDLNEFKSKLNTALTKGDPVYITNIGLYEYDYDGDFSRFFIKNYSLERVGSNLYDGWHRGAIYNNIFRNTLFRVRKR